MPRQYCPGTSIKLLAPKGIDDTGLLIDPATSICAIFYSQPPDDTQVLMASGSMDKESEGRYSFIWNSTSTALYGDYYSRIIMASGGYTLDQTQFEFALVRYLTTD